MSLAGDGRLGERGSDAEFVQEIGQQHTVRGICQLEQRGVFSIVHYAGKVFYTAEGFVMKNSDQMSADMQTLMRGCTALEMLAEELALKDSSADVDSEGSDASFTPRGDGSATPRGDGSATPRRREQKPKGASKAVTLGARLRAGIGEVSSTGKASSEGLVGLLRKTSLHYVRCVKPNDAMAAFGFEQVRVLRQLQYSGVLEMVRIRRQGFPGRMTFDEFALRYGGLILDLIDINGGNNEEISKTRSMSIARSKSISVRLLKTSRKSLESSKEAPPTDNPRLGDTSRQSSKTSLLENARRLSKGSLLPADAPGTNRWGKNIVGKVKNAFTRPEDKDEDTQEIQEMREAEKMGRGKCLAILRRANLHEHRHYQFGKTLLFLRNGVESVLQVCSLKRLQ